MEGKRVRQAEVAERASKGGKAALIAAAAAALVLIGGIVGFGLYANGYDRVFPGVSAAGEDLSGLPYEQVEEHLPTGQLLDRTVTITAGGQELGSYTQAQLGASIDTEALLEQVWAVGREQGAAGWVKNGMAMLRGRTGGKTELEPEISGYDSGKLRSIASQLAQQFDQEPVDGSYELSREGLFATKHVDGQALDQDGLVKALTGLEEGAETVEAPVKTVAAQQLDLNAMAEELRSEASPARYDVASGKVVDGDVGVSLDPQAAAFVLDAAQPGERVQLPAETIYPTLTAQELEAVLFRDTLSTTTTNVSGSSARKGNVKLAGQAVNGTVLNDGDVFDYNKVVGKRTKERGFGEAATYVNGETVNTVGGGICQVSSTIYLATLLANLEIVERYNHRFYPGYITLGMDATVSWGGPEFRFKNNTGYPIRIDVSYANSQLTVTIVGTKTDDTYVKMTHEVLSTKGYETEYVNSSDLAPGAQRQKQNGYTGYEVVTYRNIYDGKGNLISSKQEAKSSYKSRNRIVLVGTGDGSQPASGSTAAPGNDAGLSIAPQPGDGGGTAAADPAPVTPAPAPEPEPAPAPEPDPEPVLDTDIPSWLLT